MTELSSDSGRADPVITTLMLVWAVDYSIMRWRCVSGAMSLKHDLSMPDDISPPGTHGADRRNRELATAPEPICQAISPCTGRAADIVADSDMPDEVRAKLCKVRRFAVATRKTRNQRRALSALPETGLDRAQASNGDRLSGQRAEGAADQRGEW